MGIILKLIHKEINSYSVTKLNFAMLKYSGMFFLFEWEISNLHNKI
jgi:hypothetical protein